MKINTFFQACIYLTLVMLIFTLCVNFVSASGFFPVSVDTGTNINETSGNQTFSFLTGGRFSSNNPWDILLAAVGIGGIAIAAITRSTAIIGVYIFSVVFWVSFLNMWWGVVNIGGYLPVEFSTIAHGSLLFLWIGAIIGMLSGSG